MLNRRRALTAGLAAAALATPLSVAASVPDANHAPRRFVTTHQGVFNGVSVTYTATVAETLVRRATDRAATASMFTTAYVRDPSGATRPDTARPVIFMFNGGPIVSSIYLHFGAFGPLYAPVPADPAEPISTDQPLVDNPHCLLDVADLVFIDPPGTGFSRILPAAEPREFYSVDADSAAAVAAILDWLDTNDRRASPVYVLGESYGTIRAAALARDLPAAGVHPHGIMLIGQALNQIEVAQRPGNIVSTMVSLPTLAALAWHHGRSGLSARNVQDVIEQTIQFGHTDYLPALAQGHALPARERARMARRLQRFTGVPAAYFEANSLAISKPAFRSELLKDQGRVLGFYDGRYTAAAAAPGQPLPDASSAITPLYIARAVDHYRNTLGVSGLGDYELRNAEAGAGPGWDYGAQPSPFSDYPFDAWVASAMRADPRMRLFVASGVYDLTTTTGAARYLLARADFPADRVFSADYGGGHMVYTDPQSHSDLSRDVRRFVGGA